ncbi:unnamed protein product [Rotaria sp. Silwood1]|nr:unnamed protein product [Rotaria sp. Silwood1]
MMNGFEIIMSINFGKHILKWTHKINIGQKKSLHAQEKRDDVTNSRFIKKNINRLTSNIAQASATITNLQVQLSTYWTQTTAGAINPSTATTSSSAANTGRIHNAVDQLETAILEYIQHFTQHVKKHS